MAIKSHRDIQAFEKSFELAMNIWKESMEWPRHEQYGLTSQIRRSSRSVAANIAEGWAKRRHPKVFLKQILDAYGSNSEVQVWIEFAEKCNYIRKETAQCWRNQSDEIGKMLYALMNNWR